MDGKKATTTDSKEVWFHAIRFSENSQKKMWNQWHSGRNYLNLFQISIVQNSADVDPIVCKEYAENIGHFLLEFFYYEVVTYDPT